MLYKIMGLAEIYYKKDDKIYFLGTTANINNTEVFVVERGKTILSSYRIHNIFMEDGQDHLQVIHNYDQQLDTAIKQTLICRNYIWCIENAQLAGFRYIVLNSSNLRRMDENRIKVESQLINRQEKYIYIE